MLTMRVQLLTMIRVDTDVYDELTGADAHDDERIPTAIRDCTKIYFHFSYHKQSLA